MYSYMHHIRDFNSATMHLTRIERSVYLDLIHLYYEIEGQLPLDVEYLCRRIRATGVEQEINAVKSCLNEFFTETSAGYFHGTCELVINEFHHNTTSKSKAGKASAEAKRKKKQALLDKANSKKESKNNDLEHNSTGVEQAFNSVSTEHQQNSTNGERKTYNDNNKQTSETDKQAQAQNQSTIPDNYQLSEQLKTDTIKLWVVNQRPDLDIDIEFGKFVAYNKSRYTVSASWDALWSLWALNSLKGKGSALKQPEKKIESFNNDFLKRHTDKSWSIGIEQNIIEA